jgi:hypothetical protein
MKKVCSAEKPNGIKLEEYREHTAVSFCHGLRNAVRFGSIPKLSIAWATAGEKIESMS